MYEIRFENNKTFLNNVKLARSFKERLIGLMFQKSIEPDFGLYIPKCRSIHSFFMKIPIDAVFIDREFNIVKTIRNMKPWRIIPPVCRAFGVIEMKEGLIDEFNIEKGNKLFLVKKYG